MRSQQSEGPLVGNFLLLAICAALVAAALIYLDHEAGIRELTGTLEFDKDWQGFLNRAAWVTTGGVFVFVVLAEGIRRLGLAASSKVVSLALFLIVTANVAFSAWITGVLT